MANASLLSKALETPRKYRHSRYTTREHAELAVAWVKGEVTYEQAAVALDCKGANSGFKLASIIRACYAAGLITVTVNGNRSGKQ